MTDWQRATWSADGEAGDSHVGIDFGTVSGAVPEAGIRVAVVAGAYPAVPGATPMHDRFGRGVVHRLAAPPRESGGADGPSDAEERVEAC